ncbi:FkbM family methyltransferase [uncultured Methylobacterium sp.]|jgi:FkbM family methyltransferase|uniref:FkbM family methyltransferase n=1 Tax=uncultured Methylobacterium sp. TaxID=157278 RepID=UPI0026241265|nr:FkbM family methyltransferase [uncultured Methylobacterium sp.]
MHKSRYNLLQTAALFDLSTVEGRRYSHDALRDLFFDLQSFIRPKTFLEFGAFEASFSKLARHLHPASKVIAFEANPYNHKKFSSEFDFAAHNIEYHHLAVSDVHNSSINFQIQRKRGGIEASPVKGDDSLLKRHVSDVHEVYKDIEYETVSVDTVTLDSFLNAAQFGLDDFSAWIDVEGALRQSLSGAKEILKRTNSLIVEVEEKPHWSGQWLAQDVEEFLGALGFVPIARDFEFEHQYNVIFVTDRVLRHHGFNQMMVKYFERVGQKR